MEVFVSRSAEQMYFEAFTHEFSSSMITFLGTDRFFLSFFPRSSENKGFCGTLIFEKTFRVCLEMDQRVFRKLKPWFLFAKYFNFVLAILY